MITSIEEIPKIVNKIAKNNNVLGIYLFGSQATGKTHKDSDIDLIIVSPYFENMSSIQRAAKLYDYWDALFAVDFICYTPKEFSVLKKKISIVRDALSYGKIISQ